MIDWRRKPGPSGQSTPDTIQVKAPSDDNDRIRKLVGRGNVSGFGLFSCTVMLGIFYDNQEAWQRSEEIWQEMLSTTTNSQLDQIREGLTSLVVLTEQAMESDNEN